MTLTRSGFDPARMLAALADWSDGTVAHDVAACLERVRALGSPTTVVAFGACTGGGGPYWDGYAVLKGLDQVTRVDAMVPGCPPTPAALSTLVDEVRNA